MLYIFLVIAIGLLIFGIISFITADEGLGIFLSIFGGALTIATFVCLLCTLSSYNEIKSTADSRLAVLYEQNEIVLEQIAPVIEKYTDYERSTYNDLKMSPERIIAIASIYPQLKGNEFFKTQMDIIISNQKEIKNIKLEKASLNSYHMWLFTPRVEIATVGK